MHPALFRFARFVAVLSVTLVGLGAASHYVEPASFNLREMLSDPPDAAATKNEMELVLHEQTMRTGADIQRINSEVDFSPATFAEILGPRFTKANLPETFALLKNVEDDAKAVVAPAKDLWNRPRPPLQDSRVKPSVDVPGNGSYPSGHGTRGFLFAYIIGELFPQHHAELLSRGWLVGWDRVVGGVHFPSDVQAGFKLGEMIGVRLLASPTFQEDLEKARKECQRAFK